MYNRYIQSDYGTYTPIPDEIPNTQEPLPFSSQEKTAGQSGDASARKVSLQACKEWLHNAASRLHLDGGDLLLLFMLYFLYRENADEEVLFALGLLLLL